MHYSCRSLQTASPRLPIRGMSTRQHKPRIYLLTATNQELAIRSLVHSQVTLSGNDSASVVLEEGPGGDTTLGTTSGAVSASNYDAMGLAQSATFWTYIGNQLYLPEVSSAVSLSEYLNYRVVTSGQFSMDISFGNYGLEASSSIVDYDESGSSVAAFFEGSGAYQYSIDSQDGVSVQSGGLPTFQDSSSGTDYGEDLSVELAYTAFTGAWHYGTTNGATAEFTQTGSPLIFTNMQGWIQVYGPDGQLVAQSVPEPASYVSLATGLALFNLRRRAQRLGNRTRSKSFPARSTTLTPTKT